MGWLEENKPVMAMMILQFTSACVALSTRVALLQGLSPRVFVVYRQSIATLVFVPLACFFSPRKTVGSYLGMRSFCLIFITTLIGVTINQNMYFEGLYLASSSITSAMGNLVPAITFVLAAIVGLEKVHITKLTSMAKVGGTILCVGGAAQMALLKGPKLLNMDFAQMHNNSLLHLGSDNWIIGCFLLFGSCCCWSFWLLLQVPMSASYPDHLSLSAWMCFFGMLQSAVVTFFLEPDPTAWKLQSGFQLLCCFFAGIIGSGMNFFVQSWCISKRGPLFCAMFNPLQTVIVTILACIILHEELYLGSLAGSLAVVTGLYVVLWGKAKDLQELTKEMKSCANQTKTVQVLIDQKSGKIDLEQPLLPNSAVDESMTKKLRVLVG